jgi:hypothetical protein
MENVVIIYVFSYIRDKHIRKNMFTQGSGVHSTKYKSFCIGEIEES